MSFEIVNCTRCAGSGYSHAGHCPGCSGGGRVLVSSPPTQCPRCNGSGYTYSGSCEPCGGAGWALRYEKVEGGALQVAAAGSGGAETKPAAAATTVQLNSTMNNLIAEIGSVAYFTGVFISMGMNFALGNGLGALLLCWLSWVNVGYALVNLLSPGAAPPVSQ